MDNNTKLLLVQYIVVLILFIVIIYMLRQNNSLKRERRIGKYSIESINYKELSVLDKIYLKYLKLVKKARKYISKISLFKKRSKKYEKYLLFSEKKDIKVIDFITNKILISILFVMLTIFSQVLQLRIITIYELIINFIIGYYILDIYLIYKQKRRKKLIENEMLRAIMIMNNSFKAGKSTLQALEIASNELEEPIKSEFRKLYEDMSFGLNVDTVFERFAKRVDIEEVRYLSSSLTILNKTGGNIVAVFNSIERTLFDKKKLKEELKNLTLSSNMVVKVLIAVPIIFIAIIYLLNPTYFDPLFESILGYLMLFIMIVMFSIYVWFLQKIMKVDI